MFWKKKVNPSPLGVPLHELELFLGLPGISGIKCKRDGDALIAVHRHYSIRVEVVPPDEGEAESGPIKAVVRVVTELPQPICTLLEKSPARSMATFNAFATLGAIYKKGGKFFIGSRVTIHEGDDVWSKLHFPLLMHDVISGVEALFGAIRRTITGEASRGGVSLWHGSDMRQVHDCMSKLCVCTVSEDGFTAEFGLMPGAFTAAEGHHKTALFQMETRQPHPELGGGLVCILEMPHVADTEARAADICSHLNVMEMEAHDLPPHFGAWCLGRMGRNPAYVSYLHNALHSTPGIATNFAIWAMNRAMWANAMLASMGVKA